MKRSKFFKKSILGAFAIWKSPEILAILEAPLPEIKIIPKLNSIQYDDMKLTGYANHLQRELNKRMEYHILFGLDSTDPHWTPEQVKILMETKH